MVGNEVYEYVVTLPTFREIFPGVINDLVCADGSDHVHIPRTAYPGHLCAERLGDLHSERAHASRRPVNQDVLSRPNLSLVAKTLQRGECRDRYRRCLLERHVIRLHDACRLGSTRILRKGPTARAKDRVSRFELVYLPANRLNLAGHVNAQSLDLWFAQPGHHSNEVRRASHEVPVQWIDGSRAH